MSDSLRNIIDKFELGYVFTVDSFSAEVGVPVEVARILHNFVREGYLAYSEIPNEKLIEESFMTTRKKIYVIL